MAGIKTGEKMGMTEIYGLIVANNGFEKSQATAELRCRVRKSDTKKGKPTYHMASERNSSLAM